jgi:hypothetical protein
MATTLVRKPAVFPEVTEASLDQKVAEDAQQYLGYRFGDRRNQEVIEKLTRREQLVKVQAILKRCGIVPLEERSVLRYQAQIRARAIRRAGGRFMARFSWHLVDLENYKAEIPQFALARATSVAKALTRRMPRLGKTFAVSELHRQRTRAVDPDPFMVLQVLGHNFYLDVWDEPNFEGRKTV